MEDIDRNGRHVSRAGTVERAEDLAADPKVQAWVRRLKRVIRDMPKGITLHAYEDSLTPIATDDDGRAITCLDGYIDPESAVDDRIQVDGMSVGEW